VEEAALERVAERLKGHLVRSWPLEGGVSARTTAVEVRLSEGRARTFVVREHSEHDRAANPRVAADEFRLLELLGHEGIPVPTPRVLDESEEIPYIVIDYVESDPRPPGAQAALDLANALTSIHDVGPTALDLRFLPDQEARVTAYLARQRTSDEGEAAHFAVSRAWPLPERNERVLLHGDFWPGNALWKDGRLVAVIDWEDAATGDPLADVASCRLELLWAYGAEIMNAFTEHYRHARPGVDFVDLPYWDLYADLRLAPQIDRWGLDDATTAVMRERHEAFLADALRQIVRTC